MLLTKFNLLLWKNWILVKRHPIAAIFELVFPILIIMLFAGIRNLIEKVVVPATPSTEYKISDARCSLSYNKIRYLGYAPNNTYYSELMDDVVKNIEMELIGFENLTELNKWTHNQSEPVAGVLFEDTSSVPPKHLNYTIKMPEDLIFHETWDTDKLYYVGLSANQRDNSYSIKNSLYFSTCFLKLQNEIDQAFMRTVNNGSKVEKLKTIKTFPYPEVEVDVFVNYAAYGFPILFVLSMIFSAKVLIKNITIERESRLTESMKIMGLSSALYWSSWFMRSFIILIISFTINLILTVTSIISDIPMFANSNPLIIWLFFISYITSMITFCFLVSVIFKKSSRAGIVGSIVFIATVLPYMMYHDSFYRFGYGLKVLFCMLTNTNMGQGIKMILMAEINDDGVGFANLFKRSVDLKFSFGELLVWMNIGSAILMLLTIYIEKVFPGEFGLSKPWYFPISDAFKLIHKKFRTQPVDSNLESEEFLADQEAVPSNLAVGIEIKKLCKRFGDKYAVKNFSLKLYENQITVLLGHNGAGKTTAMSMLTGLYQPTSGTAVINGHDIKTNIDDARMSLGVCPQHDVLFEELTVQEHLEFFCKLKGMTDKSNIQGDIHKYTNLLGISEKLNSESRTLSGGQKRRLSIAIALCADSKFVIMDEATSGMDPSSRRHLWDLLIAEKKNRTILITTHFMDEADVLGDRIAIMSEGQLRTVGSSFFLKKTFGTGYRLTCVKQAGFDSKVVLDMIKEIIPTALKECEGETEAIFVLEKDSLPIFDHVFKKLEDNSEKLKISSFGCSFTSLEDVFLKLAHSDLGSPACIRNDSTAIEVEVHKDFQKIDGMTGILYQIYAMIFKKIHVIRRSWMMFLILGILSFVAIFLIPKMLEIKPYEPSELNISFDTYEKTETLIDIRQNSSFLTQYESLFHGKDIVTKVSEDIEDHIIKKSKKSIGTVNHDNLIALSVDNSRIIAWFNTQPYHTMPLTINTVNRAILKSVGGSDYDISLTNHPYEKSNNKLDFIKDVASSLGNFVLNFIVILFLLIIWPMIYIGHYIKEREMRFKFLQFICSTNRLVFWFTNLIFDYILFILICLVLFGCIVCLNYDKEQQLEEFKILMTIGSSFGFSWICFIYAFSYLFSKPSSGETMLLFTSIILCILSAIDYALQAGLKNPLYKFLANIYHWIGMMFAPFTLVKINTIVSASARPFEYSKIENYIILNIMSGCIFLLIVLLNDYNLFAFIFYKTTKPANAFSAIQNYDDDVQKEIQEVHNMSSQSIDTSNLVLKNLIKTYKNNFAVRDLSLNVKQHECFGLLGVNGAGKTTTFKMMTGDELITSGDIWIKGKCLKTQLLEAHKFIGYCPQFDNCIPELTGRETLKIFALIRGIKMDEITEMINQIASELDFKQHLDKQVKAYSGGNKRKLSTALALLGNPELIFLDECTTGVDPQARRQIWNAIKRIRDNHRLSSSIVITSHSMDECEALCTRIGIMVAGQFQCLGPVQHLKNKFSKGFVLTIKTGFTDENLTEKVKQKIVEKFRSAELKENYLDILTYHLKNIDLKYSEVFRKLAEIKNEMGIKDYALTQMSLEQVFLNISQN
ncbi:unnamed protein product [Chironomus riparius]|uniref:ABC transporter domain-containing protein n=1 Tax=Chironomus riparius TaxID=315576 RepID=A0A9N9S6X4_9DIPT|nr:unnamed protein product [Chironomus riparius]